MATQSTTTMSDSPVVQPLHNPTLAAQVVVPKAPLGNPGMGAKSLLAKKIANPNFVSPTDNMMTPCTQKLNTTRKKHFSKFSKPIQLFPPQKESEDESSVPLSMESDNIPREDDNDDNPF